MVTRILGLLTDIDLHIDPFTKPLTEFRNAADSSLKNLQNHIQSLVGNDAYPSVNFDQNPACLPKQASGSQKAPEFMTEVSLEDSGMQEGHLSVSEELNGPQSVDHPLGTKVGHLPATGGLADPQQAVLNPVRGTLVPDPEATIDLDSLPHVAPPLYILQHFSKWKIALGDKNRPVTIALIHANNLAMTALGKLYSTGGVPGRQNKHKHKGPLSSSRCEIEVTLRELLHSLRNLTGDSDEKYESLTHAIGYSSDTPDTEDPGE